MSRLQENETIEENILQEVSKALKLPVEAIKNFDEQAAVNYFNTFNDNTWSNIMGHLRQLVAPSIQWINYWRWSKKNKRLYEELLKSEREKGCLVETNARHKKITKSNIS